MNNKERLQGILENGYFYWWEQGELTYFSIGEKEKGSGSKDDPMVLTKEQLEDYLVKGDVHYSRKEALEYKNQKDIFDKNLWDSMSKERRKLKEITENGYFYWADFLDENLIDYFEIVEEKSDEICIEYLTTGKDATIKINPAPGNSTAHSRKKITLNTLERLIREGHIFPTLEEAMDYGYKRDMIGVNKSLRVVPDQIKVLKDYILDIPSSHKKIVNEKTGYSKAFTIFMYLVGLILGMLAIFMIPYDSVVILLLIFSIIILISLIFHNN